MYLVEVRPGLYVFAEAGEMVPVEWATPTGSSGPAPVRWVFPGAAGASASADVGTLVVVAVGGEAAP